MSNLVEDLDEIISRKRFELAQLETARDALSQAGMNFQQGGEVVGAPQKKRVKKRVPAASSTNRVKKKKAGRPSGTSNKMGMREHAMEVLKKHSSGLPIAELADKVLANGFTSSSKDFKASLYQVLYGDRKKNKNFDVDDKTGNWVLK